MHQQCCPGRFREEKRPGNKANCYLYTCIKLHCQSVSLCMFFSSFLLSVQANPNSKGQYGRTPLYRAAFAGHQDAVKVCVLCM